MPSRTWRALARNQAEVAYLDLYRAGPTVLLIHGGLLEPVASERFWLASDVAEHLWSAGFRVIAVDRRLSGGQTQCDFAEFDWNVAADDLAAVVRHLGAGPIRVVAASNGCSAALRLALDHADLVDQLVLCWPATSDARLDQPIDAGIDRLATEARRLGPARLLDRRHELKLTGVAAGLRAVIDADPRAAADFCRLSGQEAARRLRGNGNRLLRRGVLRGVGRREAGWVLARSIVVPATPDDPVHLHSTVDDLVRRLPEARASERFPTIPHRLFPARKDAFLAALTAWLAD